MTQYSFNKITIILILTALSLLIGTIFGLELTIPIIIGIVAVFALTGSGKQTVSDLFEIKRIVSILVLIMFSISPLIRILQGFYSDSGLSLITAELIALFGFLSYLLGYSLISKSSNSLMLKRYFQKVGNLSNSGLLSLVFLIIVFQLFTLYLNKYAFAVAKVSFGAWDNIIDLISSYAVVLLFVLTLRIKEFKNNFIVKAGWIILFVTCLFMQLISGWKGKVLILFLIPLIASYYKIKKFYAGRFLVILILFFLIVYPMMYLYRAQAIFQQYNLEVAPSITESIVSWDDVLQSGVTDNIGSIFASFDASVLTERTDMLEPLTRIATMTKIPENLLYGKTISLFFISLFVPRFLWDDKPDIDIGKWFGMEYGYSSFYGQSSIAMTLFGEFYLNFWWLGLILGMVFMGSLHAFIYKNLSPYKTHDDFKLSVYFICLLTTFNIGTSFAISYAGLVKQLLIWSLIWYIFARLFTSRNKRITSA